MVLSARVLTNQTAAGGLRDIARFCGAFAVTLLAFTAATLAETETASATSLPPVQITYSGKMSLEVFPTKGKPAHQLRTLSWTATSNSAGSDGALALDFSSVSGSSSTEGNGNCYDATATLSLATAKNPIAGGWFLNETSDFPSPGWKYIAIGVPGEVPVLEAQKGSCSSFQSEELLQPNEMLLNRKPSRRRRRRNTKPSSSRSSSPPASPRPGPGLSPSTASATAHACLTKPTSRRA